MVNYFELGKDKQLNEIVIPGSHDAGINRGGSNVQTQELDIRGQATVGVRVFDLRIAAAAVDGRSDGHKVVELKAFHADKSLMKDAAKTRYLEDVGRTVQLDRTNLRGGAFGMGLTAMLRDARAFVESKEGATEFLILKFDKCLNWLLIAEACTRVLDKALYKGGGNLNTTKLGALSGHVIVCFTSEGIRKVQARYGPRDGIFRIDNLYDSGQPYSPTFDGLQYYGKGGTAVSKPAKKMKQNEKKQGKLMDGAKSLQAPDVMGMMYWTSTGLVESIKKRNEAMWDAPNVERLRRLWAQGLGDFVEDSIPFAANRSSAAVGPLRKQFMPNIVMIDFADPWKCQEIRELNDLSPNDLAGVELEDL